MAKKPTINFSDVYREYAPAIERFIYFRVSDPEAAADLCQEVFLKSWAYARKPGAKIKNTKSFLYKVAKNLVIDHYKDKEKRPFYYDEVNPIELSYNLEIEEGIDKKAKRRVVMENIKSLKSIHRKILVYRFVKDCSINEISRATNKSPNYVSVLIHEGTRILKNKVERRLPSS